MYIYEGKYAISRENLANKSLRNCDVRQVLCILTIFCPFKLKNVCILPKFSTFQSFQSKIILVKVVKKSLSLQSKFFFEFSVLSANIFVCKFVYIVRTDQNPSGSCQPFSILYIIMMTACAAAYRATCVKTSGRVFVLVFLFFGARSSSCERDVAFSLLS